MALFSKLIGISGGMARVQVTSAQKAALIEQLTIENKYTGKRINLYKSIPQASNNLGIILDGIRCLEEMLIPVGMIDRPHKHDSTIPPSIQFKGALRPEQIQLVDKAIPHLLSKGGGIIKAETGTGKTVIGIDIICTLNLKTLIIVPTEYLMGQWEDRIIQFTNVPKHQIGRIIQNKCEYGMPICVGMIHSLSKVGRYPADMYNEFDMVIWDEVHRLAAPTFSETGSLFNADIRLGLSATPRRADGLENVFKYHIGEVIQGTMKQPLKPLVIMQEYVDIKTGHNGLVRNGELNLGGYLNRVSSVSQRNKLLSLYIKKSYEKGRSIMLLTDRLDQVDEIHDILMGWGIAETKFDTSGRIIDHPRWATIMNPIGIFTGSTKRNLKAPIILATYGSAGLGADLPHLNTLVIGTPRADIEQAAGRILRADTDKSPVIVDFVDSKSSIMAGWAKKRRKFYAEKGFEIKELRHEVTREKPTRDTGGWATLRNDDDSAV